VAGAVVERHGWSLSGLVEMKNPGGLLLASRWEIDGKTSDGRARFFADADGVCWRD
jgi:hypothetical protein